MTYSVCWMTWGTPSSPYVVIGRVTLIAPPVSWARRSIWSSTRLKTNGPCSAVEWRTNRTAMPEAVARTAMSLGDDAMGAGYAIISPLSRPIAADADGYVFGHRLRRRDTARRQ